MGNDTIQGKHLLLFAFALLAGAPASFAQQPQQMKPPQRSVSAAVQTARASFHGSDLEGKDGPMAKVGLDLILLHQKQQAFVQGGKAGKSFQPSQSSSSLRVQGGRVLVEAVANPGRVAALRADLEAMGLRGAAAAGLVVSGWLPMDALDEAAALKTLRFARPPRPVVRGASVLQEQQQQQTGSVVSQGVVAMRAGQARNQFDVDGDGVTVGVLSDSYDCLGGEADDVASGDLPSDVNVLAEGPACSLKSDEGRAMAQIVHDVAPESDIAFHTASGGIPRFAQGIRELAAAGAEVIVDDTGYPNAPMFQEGRVAQAVNDVVGDGVAYFSAAGNSGDQSYESTFRSSGEAGSVSDSLHDFNPRADIDSFQDIAVPQDGSVKIRFQWAQPYFSAGSNEGARSDVDVFLTDLSGTIQARSVDSNIGRDPVEVLQFSNDEYIDANDDGRHDEQFYLVLKLFAGPAPNFMKYIYSGIRSSVEEYNTYSSTLFGHPNASGAEAVGASRFYFTPQFNSAAEVPIIKTSSALGGTPILFGPNGDRLTEPEVRRKPNIVGPDGGNTTFFDDDFPDILEGGNVPGEDDSLPNFSGTSAAAPHVAGVAALMLDAASGLSPFEVYRALEGTATDMDPIRNGEFEAAYEGFGLKTGYGYVDAVAAIGEALPVELASFEATAEDDEAVLLTWKTVSETGNAGFHVERSTDGGASFEEVTFVEGAGTTTEAQTYRFTDTDVPFETKRLTYRLRQKDFDGDFEKSKEVEAKLRSPSEFALHGAFPNPFRTAATIRYEVPRRTHVRLAVYDALGRRVRTLVDEEQKGRQEVSFAAEDLASGTYFYRLEADDRGLGKSMVLVQ